MPLAAVTEPESAPFDDGLADGRQCRRRRERLIRRRHLGHPLQSQRGEGGAQRFVVRLLRQQVFAADQKVHDLGDVQHDGEHIAGGDVPVQRDPHGRLQVSRAVIPEPVVTRLAAPVRWRRLVGEQERTDCPGLIEELAFVEAGQVLAGVVGVEPQHGRKVVDRQSVRVECQQLQGRGRLFQFLGVQRPFGGRGSHESPATKLNRSDRISSRSAAGPTSRTLVPS